MNDIWSTIGSAFSQLFLFSLVPFFWWLFTARNENFFKWIGLKKMKTVSRNHFLPAVAFCLIFFSLLGIFLLKHIGHSADLAAARFYGLGLKGLFSIFIYSFVQTGLSEELFFRGFLAKRLIQKLGFSKGNALQAIVFGLIHSVLLFQQFSIAFIVFIFLFTGFLGWLMGYINEKTVDGSLFPSWIIHSFSNFISSAVYLFSFI